MIKTQQWSTTVLLMLMIMSSVVVADQPVHCKQLINANFYDRFKK